jgi:Zn-dependent M16 (insulinase) family peptidase
MTTAIFEELQTDLNQMMEKENQNILLLADNHRHTKVMSNVTMKFLQPNLIC